jgi:hypothetical protein
MLPDVAAFCGCISTLANQEGRLVKLLLTGIETQGVEMALHSHHWFAPPAKHWRLQQCTALPPVVRPPEEENQMDSFCQSSYTQKSTLF